MTALRAELAAIARAYAAVLFRGDARLGAILIAFTLLVPSAGLAGLLACVVAHATSLALGFRTDLRRCGAHGYNAALLGLYLAAGRQLDVPLALWIALGGAASVVLTVVLAEALHRAGGLPVLVLPFVVLAIAMQPALPVPVATGLAADSLLPLAMPWTGSFHDAMRGLAAIFCSREEIVGLGAFAVVLIGSRLAATALVVGVVAAMTTGALAGVPIGSQLATTLVYNGAFTGLALGAELVVPGRAALFVAALGSAFAAIVAIGAGAITLRFGVPVLSAPFALVTLAIVRALQLRVVARPPFPVALPGATPEANLEFVANLARRFGAPGVPEFALPLGRVARGEWIVSQGVDGEHTHRGAWEHAWDFEVVDERGFPFGGHGDRIDHYFGFDAPVLAAAAGTVAAVHDGAPDGVPGTLDATRPWGNAVVLRHGHDLFSVVAHLRCGSVRVRPGQPVMLGELLGTCGASGRSPRPHVHFQAQRSDALGAPAMEARFVHYSVRGSDGSSHGRAFGVPVEGERIRALPRAPLAGLFAAVAPGTLLEFEVEPGATRLSVRSEISPLGERWLADLDRGDRLYFFANAHELVFTTHAGPADAPLRALLLALPRLPHGDAEEFHWNDSPPIGAMLPRWARILRAVVRVVFDPFDARAELRAQRTGDVIVVESTAGWGLRGRVRMRWHSRVEVDDSHGMRRIELTDALTHRTVTFTRRGVAHATAPSPTASAPFEARA
ncbi:MAG: urea transporter [Planctomycetes bacterium]|nr:urea transporter [Planctomycetota bacterium]